MLPRELRQYTNHKIFITLGAIIIIALIGTMTSILALSALSVVRASGQTNTTTISHLQDLLLQLRTAESSERGYLLTSDTDFLTGYRSAVKATHDDLTQLAAVQPNFSQSYHISISSLASLTEARITLMDQATQSYQAGDASPAALEDNFARGQTETNQISASVQHLTAQQTAQLTMARHGISTLSEVARGVSLGTLFLTLILAGVVNYLYARGIQAERNLDRAKDEFVSLASHQLRTPVTGIKAILSSLAAEDFGPLEPRQSYFVKKALASSERELAIIEELLDVAKADAGRLVLHPDQLDLTKLVAGVVAEQRTSIESKHLTLKLTQPTSPTIITADEEKLYMAIGNLLDNARKYTPESGIISIKTYTKHKSAAIEIADTGVGIDADDLEHIFERFGRAHTAPGNHIDGTGLGLYLAHYIAELHHGAIKVASKKGHGSKFTITLPRGSA